MAIINEISNWKNKKILLIGEALIDNYIFGYTDSISPDAPVPNVKIENNISYIGASGLVLQFIKSLGGFPEACTIIGNDYEGDFFLKRLKELKVDTSGILVDENIKTPQITRVKAMNQHLLRLETDYGSELSDSTINKFNDIIKSSSEDIEAIIILDYGIGGLFEDRFIQNLISLLKEKYQKVPIIVRPNKSNYYLYENVELIRINLQKALQTFSIDCCNDTSVSIVGKRILSSSKCKHVLLNYLETESYLFSRDTEETQKIFPILQQPVRSFNAVGSAIMATLGLSFASNIHVLNGVKIALYAGALTTTLPPIEFYNIEKLKDFISANSNNR